MVPSPVSSGASGAPTLCARADAATAHRTATRVNTRIMNLAQFLVECVAGAGFRRPATTPGDVCPRLKWKPQCRAVARPSESSRQTFSDCRAGLDQDVLLGNSG